MSADLEQSLSKEIRGLNDDQQREVLAFVEKLKRQSPHTLGKRFSFIGIGGSGKKDLSQRAEEILEQNADRREGWSLSE